MRLLLLCGPAFSGKTALSRLLEAHGVVRISLDDILRGRGLEPGAELPDRAWQDAFFAAQLLISAAAQRGQNAVLDDRLARRSLRDCFRSAGEEAGMPVFLVVLRTSEGAVRERAERIPPAQRARMHEARLDHHLATFEWPGADEPHIELDGTWRTEQQLFRLRQSIAAAQKNSSSTV